MALSMESHREKTTSVHLEALWPMLRLISKDGFCSCCKGIEYCYYSIMIKMRIYYLVCHVLLSPCVTEESRITVKMRRLILAVLLCVFSSGCVSSHIIPKESVLQSKRILSVVPIEGPPLILHPDTRADRTAIVAMRAKGSGDSLSQPDAQFLNVPSTPVGATTLIAGMVLLFKAAFAEREVSGETPIIEMGQPSEIWMPTVEYSKTAVVELRKAGHREIQMIDGYVKLPISDRSITWNMENWLVPIRHLYNSDLSTVDYAAIDSKYTDAIIEVGVMNYEYSFNRLLLQVFVKLVDPRTKQVLGRSRKSSYLKTEPLARLLQNDAEALKRIILETGNRLLAKCLAELGLTPNSIE